MLKNINDTTSDAKKLIKLISGIPAKINLIPFNPWPNSPYENFIENKVKQTIA
jgi:23S rRNA (adenine2503-C2)-methyltransferase